MQAWAARLALMIYVACFAAGAFNHARDFMARGWRPYAAVPPQLELFYMALLPLDLAVVGLLVTGWRRSGLSLALGIMLVDVRANAWLALREPVPYLAMPLLLQTLFLGFILGSVVFLWPAMSRR